MSIPHITPYSRFLIVNFEHIIAGYSVFHPKCSVVRDFLCFAEKTILNENENYNNSTFACFAMQCLLQSWLASHMRTLLCSIRISIYIYTSATRVFEKFCYIHPWLLVLQLDIISMMSKGLNKCNWAGCIYMSLAVLGCWHQIFWSHVKQ